MSKCYEHVLGALNGRLPVLNGNLKQTAWAYRIRDYYIENCQYSLDVLKKHTCASYWTDNKELLIGKVDLSMIKLEPLTGNKFDLMKAYPIREAFASRFPDVPFVHSQTVASFWVDNLLFLDLILATPLSMDVQASNPPVPSLENVEEINLNHYPGMSPVKASVIADVLMSVKK